MNSFRLPSGLACFVQRFGRLWLYGIMACGLQVAVNVICLFGQGKAHRAYILLEWSPVVILAASLVLALLAWHVVGKGRCLWRSVLFALSAAYWLLPLDILLIMRGGGISYLGDYPSEYFCALALHFGVAPGVLAVILWLKSEAPWNTREEPGRPVFSRLWGCCLAALALEALIYMRLGRGIMNRYGRGSYCRSRFIWRSYRQLCWCSARGSQRWLYGCWVSATLYGAVCFLLHC